MQETREKDGSIATQVMSSGSRCPDEVWGTKCDEGPTAVNGGRGTRMGQKRKADCATRQTNVGALTPGLPISDAPCQAKTPLGQSL